MTLHDAAGVAYDAPTQSELRSVIVHVGGLYSAAFGAPSSLALGTGASSTVGVRVVNAGSEDWDVETPTPPTEPDSLLIWLRTQRTAARVVATWVSPQGLPVPASVSAAIDPKAAAPGGSTAVGLSVVAPSQAGDYLLLLDVVTPTHGALSDAGQHPGPDPGRRDGADDRAVGRRRLLRRQRRRNASTSVPRAPALVGGD